MIIHGNIKIIRVLPGCVGLMTINGKPVVLQAGRHLFNDPLATWVGMQLLTSAHIVLETLHLITVANDEVGLCSVANTAHFLGPGRHVFNTPAFTFRGVVSAITDYITLHSKHRVFVPNGKLALISVEGSPQILEPGLHNFDASRFYWGGLQDATAPYLAVGSLHRLFVTAGRVACYTLAGVGTVLSEPGVRLIDSPTFLFERMADATETFLRVGSAARIVVPTGHLGKLTVGGEARLLEPGSYMLNDSNLRYDGAVKATEPLIVHGHLKAVLVPRGA